MHGSTPKFLQGVYYFEGQGLEKPQRIEGLPDYVVPPGSTTQPVYFRGGNSTDELICVVLVRDGAPMRYFPISAKGSTHVSLRIVEDLLGDTRVELQVSAPEGLTGQVVVDLGLVEV